ncbi:uncharacterized protein G2W53_021639 [Senna tora]|uniref:Uncharacterized protein n=1 Tax=Senna tora TaxID=362788 RepID=A0A834TM98_9FABA|nr:uncharacterized protein G2W53_021639 [Senna tora]
MNAYYQRWMIDNAQSMELPRCSKLFFEADLASTMEFDGHSIHDFNGSRL